MNQLSSPLVIVMAHGSRHPQGKAQAEHLMDRLVESAPHPVLKAYLEILEPDLHSCIVEHTDQTEHFIIIPLLIFKGGHALRDIPGIIEQCREEYPNHRFTIGPVIDPRGDFLNFWVEEVRIWQESQNGPSDLLLLGRGAIDEEAKESFSHVHGYLERALGKTIDTAFTGLQEPGLETAMSGRAKERPVMILPCLLFDGVLLERARENVAGYSVTWGPTLSHSPELLPRLLKEIDCAC